MIGSAASTLVPPEPSQPSPASQPTVETTSNEPEGAKEADATTKEIRKTARKLRLISQIQRLQELEWDPIKHLKRGYIPKHTRFKNLQGQLVSDNERADALADYFEQVQWKPDTSQAYIDSPPSFEPIFPLNPDIKTEPVSTHEMYQAIRRLKTGKAPGPDGITAELFKILDDDTLELVRQNINNIWYKEMQCKANNNIVI